jgi:hypothetical protein
MCIVNIQDYYLLHMDLIMYIHYMHICWVLLRFIQFNGKRYFKKISLHEKKNYSVTYKCNSHLSFCMSHYGYHFPLKRYTLTLNQIAVKIPNLFFCGQKLIVTGKIWTEFGWYTMGLSYIQQGKRKRHKNFIHACISSNTIYLCNLNLEWIIREGFRHFVSRVFSHPSAELLLM